MNLISPTSGTAEILGVDSRRISRKELSQIGYVSENQELPGGLTVSQYLRYLRPFYPQWDESLEKEVLEQFDLPEDRRIGDLSHGMRVKFALACALPYRPKLLVLDEPLSGLDPLVRDEFMESLAARAEEMTILISSHDLAEVEGFATDVAFVDQGKLLFQESMETLTGRVQQIKVTVERQTVMRLPMPESWIDVHEFGNVLTFIDTQFSGVGLDEQIRSRLDGVRHIDIQSVPLRSIFTSLAKATRKPVS
jgi:ABC-2 type transport system ATP-binding protein